MMVKNSIKIAAGVMAILSVTGCGRYEEFDMLDEYMKRPPETIITDTAEVFGCHAERISERAGGREITELYLKAFDEGEKEGYVPVLVCLDDMLEDMIKYNFGEKTREEYVSEILSAEREDGKTLFGRYYSELEKYFGEELEIDGSYADAALAMDRGRKKYLSSGEQLGGDLYLVRVPAEKPYEIFAWLPFCGGCTCVNEMIAMCEYWYNEYGAVPAEITHDTLTFYLSEPVSDKETVLKAAKEQCAFASDIIGMGGVRSYVQMTMNSNTWMFWWD